MTLSSRPCARMVRASSSPWPRGAAISNRLTKSRSRTPSPLAFRSIAAAKSTRSISRNTSMRTAQHIATTTCGRHRPCFGGCRGFGAGHCRPLARTLLRLGLDGSGCGSSRSRRYRRLVIYSHPRHRRHFARYESRPQHGRAHARDNRDRRRSIDRFAFVAPRSRPFGRNRVGGDAAAARAGILSIAAQPISRSVPRHGASAAPVIRANQSIENF